MVIAFHAGLPLPGGFAGVDVFFVISGFVITGMLKREQDATGRIRLRSFYARRFRRLTPALAAMVATVVVLAAALLSPLGPQEATLATAVGALLLFANYATARFTGGYFDTAADLNPLLHTWTLSLEEQFYLVFPALLILGWWLARRSGRQSLALVAVGALGAASVAVAMVGANGVTFPLLPDGFVGFYGPVGRAWEFAAGALLALAAPALSRIPSLVASVAGLVLLVATALFVSGSAGFPGPATLLPVFGALLLILGGSTPNRIALALSWRPAVVLGDLSYSWYLWHWPFIVIARQLQPDQTLALTVAAALALVPAIASYRWIESPLRSSRTPLPILATSALVPALAVAGMGLVALSNGYWSPGVQAAQRSQGPHAGYLAGCMSFEPMTDARKPSCTWNSAKEGVPVYLLGDSIADHYSEGLIAASAQAGRPLSIAVAAGCPIYPIVLEHNGHAETVTAAQCGAYSVGTLAWMDTQQPGLVLIGETDSAWWDPTREYISDLAPFVASDKAKAAAIALGMRNAVERLQAAGHTVVLAMPPPSYRYPGPAWDPTLCFLWEFESNTCTRTRTVAQMDALQGQLRDVIRKVADETGATVFDLRNYFCPAGICSTSREGESLYLDAIHISTETSLALTPRFVALLEPH